MRRLLSLAAFAAGFWYLWTTRGLSGENLAGIGLMGFGLLLDFAGRDS